MLIVLLKTMIRMMLMMIKLMMVMMVKMVMIMMMASSWLETLVIHLQRFRIGAEWNECS